jgi:hypothetical protein
VLYSHLTFTESGSAGGIHGGPDSWSTAGHTQVQFMWQVTAPPSGMAQLQVLITGPTGPYIWSPNFDASNNPLTSPLFALPSTTQTISWRVITQSATNGVYFDTALYVCWDGENCVQAGQCQYGVQKKQPQYDIVTMGFPLLDALGLAIEGPWIIPIVLAHGAATVSLDTLCSGPPFPPATINPSDWSTPDPLTHLTLAEAKSLNNFQNWLWDKFCQ